MDQTYTIRIKNGTNSIRHYRIRMWWQHYTYIPQTKNKGYYEKKECSRREKNRMYRFCHRHMVILEAVPTRYTRSKNYRNQFFAKNKTFSDRYRCAYCGKKLPREKITVDHIFPVHCMEKYPAVRKKAALFGIHGSNDVKNLCAACKHCNQRKATKMGRWVFRGFLGKKSWYWPLRKLLRFTGVCLILYWIGLKHSQEILQTLLAFQTAGHG